MRRCTAGAALMLAGLGIVALTGCPPRKAPSAEPSAERASAELRTETSVEPATKASMEPATEASAEPATEAMAEKVTCCAECRAAASQDPQARDLETVECGSYAGRVVNGQPALSEACAAWFRENPTMVGECAR